MTGSSGSYDGLGRPSVGDAGAIQPAGMPLGPHAAGCGPGRSTRPTWRWAGKADVEGAEVGAAANVVTRAGAVATDDGTVGVPA